MTILQIGSSDALALEGSYARALERAGHSVHTYDLHAAVAQQARFGRLGRWLHNQQPIDAWRQRANRTLAAQLRAWRPRAVLVYANAPVLVSTLAFAKTALPRTRWVLLWPDPLTNLHPHVVAAAPLYDGVAAHSRAAMPVFEQLGFTNVRWVPLAADPALHHVAEADVVGQGNVVANEPSSPGVSTSGVATPGLSFVGAWRPEREHVLSAIARQFPALSLHIWGTDWHRLTNRQLRPCCHGRALRGQHYARLTARSTISLNPIDATGYPAANMRFFEIPVAGGLQLASACPELADQYRNGEHVLYYASDEDLFAQIDRVLTHPERAAAIRRAGQTLTLARHTYDQRVWDVVELLTGGGTN